MTEQLTFIRHGLTHNNVGNKSEKDTRLTDKGKKMCGYLDGYFDLILCSTLWRTKETLQCSNLTYDVLLYSDLCREYKNKSYDNYQIREEVEPESKEDFLVRLRDFQNLLVELSQIYDRICVIAHSGTLSKLTGMKFKNADRWDTDIDSYLDEHLINI